MQSAEHFAARAPRVRSGGSGAHRGRVVVDEGVERRAPSGLRKQNNSSSHVRFTASYITGSHAIKVGVVDTFGYIFNGAYAVQPVSYRFISSITPVCATGVAPSSTQTWLP